MNIKLTQEEFNYTLNALAQRPFAEVAQLIFKLQAQASSASAAQPSTDTQEVAVAA